MRHIRCINDNYSFTQKDFVYEAVYGGTHEGVYYLNRDVAVAKEDFEVVEEIYVNKFQSDTIISMLEQELMCTGYSDEELDQLVFMKEMLEKRSFE